MSDEYISNLDVHEDPYRGKPRTPFSPLIPKRKTLSDSSAQIPSSPHSTSKGLDWQALDEFQ